MPKSVRNCNSNKDGEEAAPTMLARPLAQAAAATLVFAQEEAGTAACNSSSGILLACSHCVAETLEEYLRKEDKWLLFASGCIVRAKCVAYDLLRDLALLQVVAAQGDSVPYDNSRSFHAISIGNNQAERLLCIRHPGFRRSRSIYCRCCYRL